jgi:hypothetical protein
MPRNRIDALACFVREPQFCVQACGDAGLVYMPVDAPH